MKKIFVLALGLSVLVGCSEKEAYEKALLEYAQKDQDTKDYNIAPEEMAKCIFETSSENMPGFAIYDPYRRLTYERYVKMLSANKATDPKKAFEELKTLFGSPKKLGEAHSNFTESVMECYTLINEKRGEAKDKAEAEANAKSAAAMPTTPATATPQPSAPAVATVPTPAPAK
jgi:hypothetical protein